MTPMFSAYVVVGDPPTEVAITVPMPSAATARPITGSRSCPVISATAFTWPTFSATSAMTAGSTSRENVIEKLGRCQPTADRLPSMNWLPTRPLGVCGGNPNQSALFTPDQSTLQWVVAWAEPGSGDVILPKARSASQETT